MAPSSTSATFIHAQASDQVAGRQIVISRASILGGGSSINFMMYSRPQAIDFDDFQTDGWGQRDMIPIFKRLETYHAQDGVSNNDTHGAAGPIQISSGTWPKTAFADDFLQAAANRGFPMMDDMQDFKSVQGYERMQRYIAPNGIRSDAAHGYIHPILQNGKDSNLHVLLHNRVSRIIFDTDKKATGLEYVSTSRESRSDHLPKTVKAKKLVVLSCGALETPALLERSGLGRRDHLEQLGVSVISDLPGVGENLQDHPFIVYPYKSTLNEDETLDHVLRNPAQVPDLMAERNPILGTNGIELFGRLRMSQSEINESRSDALKDMWNREYDPRSSKPLMLSASAALFIGNPAEVPPGQYFTIGNLLPYPLSRGSVHASSKDVDGALELRTGFFEGRGHVDLAAHIWAYKVTREISRRLSCFAGELEAGHPKFPHGSKAEVTAHPVAGEKLADIEYTPEDDEAIEAFIRSKIQTAWHSLGSAGMRPRDSDGVVDKNLNVYGVSGLKIVGKYQSPHDCTVMVRNP
ncbi:hypothetical protein NQ176_g8441 [Zarea fungicola]|uniref:Uncharacterized protein n=1 Tax=Zarea fungicola TaxID=93591 RepID=A0ACC1MS94_9HYPO|nr:hypothetical protein NQ176_g8441 [Lecanicillium fungicola]